jgi:PAS domain S-box-containing protein
LLALGRLSAAVVFTCPVAGLALEREVAERREVEKRQARLIEIFNNTTDLVSIVTMEGRYLELNRVGRKRLGVGESDALPTVSLWEILSPEEMERFKGTILPILLREGVWSGEVKRPSVEGQPETFASQVVLLHRGPDGAPEAISTISRDVTEQKQLQERQSHLVSILDNTPGFVGICDMEGRYTYPNPSARQLLHLGAQEELPATPLFEHFSPSAQLFFEKELVPALLRDGVWSGETTLTTIDGKESTIYRVSLLHRSPDGTPKYVSTISRDMTEQKRTRRAVRHVGRE